MSLEMLKHLYPNLVKSGGVALKYLGTDPRTKSHSRLVFSVARYPSFDRRAVVLRNFPLCRLTPLGVDFASWKLEVETSRLITGQKKFPKQVRQPAPGVRPFEPLSCPGLPFIRGFLDPSAWQSSQRMRLARCR